MRRRTAAPPSSSSSSFASIDAADAPPLPHPSGEALPDPPRTPQSPPLSSASSVAWTGVGAETRESSVGPGRGGSPRHTPRASLKGRRLSSARGGPAPPPATPTAPPPAVAAADAVPRSGAALDEEPWVMDLDTARHLAASLAPRSPTPVDDGAPAAEPAVDPAWVRFHLNGSEARVPRAEPYVHPATLFAPHVLLLDCTAAVHERARRGGGGGEWGEPTSPAPRVAALSAAQATLTAERRRLKNVRDGLRSRLKRPRPGRPGAAQAPPTSAPAPGTPGGGQGGVDDGLQARLSAADEQWSTVTCELQWVRDALATERKALARWEGRGKGGGPVLRRARGVGATPAAAPPILLLPSPSTGLVRVVEGHHYVTVKFIGEHLRLTGRLDAWLPPDVGRSPTTATAAEPTPSSRSGLPPEWVGREYGGLLRYLRLHPDCCADDYFKLPAEELAAHTEAYGE